MAAPWDSALDARIPGPSFIDRVRAAPDDADVDDFAMGDDPVTRGRAGGLAVLGQDLAEETALQQLIRHWMNERHAPDILPGQEMLLGRLLVHIRKQVSLWSASTRLSVRSVDSRRRRVARCEAVANGV